MGLATGETNALNISLSSSGGWSFSVVTDLPAIVTPSSIIAVTKNTYENIHVDKKAPDVPAPGDIWFWIDDPTVGLLSSSGSSNFECYGAFQYLDGVWSLTPSYYAWMGLWIDLPSLPPIGTSLEDCTWDQIHRIGQAGKEAEYFLIGDTKSVTLTTGELIEMRIIGMRHDLLEDGTGYAPFTFHMANCLNANDIINSGNVVTGGWNLCQLREKINGSTYYGVVPEDVRNVIKTVQKSTTSGNTTTITISMDKMWLLSTYEVSGSTSNAFSGEGNPYAYYTTTTSRIKLRSGSAATWWLRSVKNTSNSDFCYIDTGGSTTYGGAASGRGIAFAFCV